MFCEGPKSAAPVPPAPTNILPDTVESPVITSLSLTFVSPVAESKVRSPVLVSKVFPELPRRSSST